MKITRRQLRRIIRETTMWQLWAQYDRGAVRAADTAIKALGLTPETAVRTPGGAVESEIHHYLEQEAGLSRTSDKIFKLGDEALEVVAIMLGLPKDTF